MGREMGWDWGWAMTGGQIQAEFLALTWAQNATDAFNHFFCLHDSEMFTEVQMKLVIMGQFFTLSFLCSMDVRMLQLV